MINERLDEVRLMMLGRVQETSYPEILTRMVLECIPTEDIDMLLKNLPDGYSSGLSEERENQVKRSEEKGFHKISYDDAVEFLAPILSSVINVDDLKSRISSAKYKTKDKYDSLIGLCNFEGIILASENILADIIKTAESEDSATKAPNKLKEVLNDTDIPDVIIAIRKTAKEEFKKSNKELEKIKEKDAEVIPDNNESPLDAGEPFMGDNPDENSTPLDNDADDGDNGAVFSESFKVKYSDILEQNLAYIVNDTISKMVFKYMSDANLSELSDVMKTNTRLLASALLALGIMLGQFGLMSAEDYKSKLEYALFGD